MALSGGTIDANGDLHGAHEDSQLASFSQDYDTLNAAFNRSNHSNTHNRRESSQAFGAAVAKALRDGMAKLEIQFGKQTEVALSAMQAEMACQMQSQFSGLEGRVLDKLSARCDERKGKSRKLESSSDSSSSDDDIPSKDRPFVPLNDLRTPHEDTADWPLINSAIRRVLEKQCPLPWSWELCNKQRKLRILIHVKRCFRNGKKFSETWLKEKIRNTLKGMRSYIREKIRLVLRAKWDGDLATVKKMPFDHSLTKEQLNMFLPEEQIVCAYLNVEDDKEELESYPVPAEGEVQNHELTKKEEEIRKSLAHWESVYERVGPIPARRKLAVDRAKKIQAKVDAKEISRHHYGQGGPASFAFAFRQAFRRPPTREEDEFARNRGSLRCMEKVAAEEENKGKATNVDGEDDSKDDDSDDDPGKETAEDSDASQDVEDGGDDQSDNDNSDDSDEIEEENLSDVEVPRRSHVPKKRSGFHLESQEDAQVFKRKKMLKPVKQSQISSRKKVRGGEKTCAYGKVTKTYVRTRKEHGPKSVQHKEKRMDKGHSSEELVGLDSPIPLAQREVVRDRSRRKKFTKKKW